MRQLRTKPCEREGCAGIIEQRYTESVKKFESRRFCSIACKALVYKGVPRPDMVGRPAWNKGMKQPRGRNFIPCRICGEPTRYQGTPAAGARYYMLHCEREECVKASRLLKNERIGDAHRGVPKPDSRWKTSQISPQEELVKPWFLERGWKFQHRVIPGTNARSYILDFAHTGWLLDVEIDGSSHRKPERIVRDATRDERLSQLGWKILRLPAELVDSDVESVYSQVEFFSRANCA